MCLVRGARDAHFYSYKYLHVPPSGPITSAHSFACACESSNWMTVIVFPSVAFHSLSFIIPASAERTIFPISFVFSFSFRRLSALGEWLELRACSADRAGQWLRIKIKLKSYYVLRAADYRARETPAVAERPAAAALTWDSRAATHFHMFRWRWKYVKSDMSPFTHVFIEMCRSSGFLARTWALPASLRRPRQFVASFFETISRGCGRKINLTEPETLCAPEAGN